ncbi:ABC transporter permease [Mucilaginibacter xinganensis]|uniref:Cell division protein FtsX n=1 Tax=Mucilaginibacter xinganensis TaxID=1234841 RepID=A0A223P3V8_9SPHI|nr:ABC transporter permease [Mucilaginibacter xinganensis]ASU36766.1 cell division protein FtsX [Mucilaginibacter xinganensis]
MFKNYIKTAFRSLLKNKGFTFINVLGLALGLATCLLIVFYVFDELSYDRFNIKHDRIYRVNTDLKAGTNETSFAITAPPVGDALVKEYPEVESAMRIGQGVNIRFKKGNEVIDEKKAFYCDNAIFHIFTLPLLQGDAKTALTEANSMVISKDIAIKYFNTIDVVGKVMLLVSDSSLHKVTGVMENMPAQSHFYADILLGMQANKDHSWSHFNTGTYILLKQGADPAKLTAQFPALIRRNETTPAFDYGKFEAKGNYIRLSLTSLIDIHLHSNRQRELGINGNVQYIYIFSVIAIFILALACINFMNLSTARSANRAREVGVRKVLGSSRKSLIAQFLSESLMVTLAATVIAVLAAWVVLPLFNQISGKSLNINAHTFTWLLPALLVIILVVGILAGSYPAFFLSAFQPIQVLKGKLATGFKGSFLRSFLVVFQFSISIFLIIGTLVIYNQLTYIRNKDLGFNRNQVLIIKNVNSIDPKVLKQQVKQIPGVLNATLTHYLPTSNLSALNYVSYGSNKNIETQFWQVDADYISTMGMKLMQGRNFNEQFLSDSSSVIINETMARMIGYKGDAAEKISNGKDYKIIGVVKDFNFSSLRSNITPVMLVMQRDWMASLSVRVNTANLPPLMQQIEKKWKALQPNLQFDYSFMDEDFNALYHNEQRMGALFVIFTTLAIIIACLGLFGLAAYAAEQRNREISIRKVLGANVSTLVATLSKDFIKLVLIAIVIATPLAWLIMQKWLQSFAYRQNIQWWVLAVTALCALVIAFATVSYQSMKAALVNPVDSLRSE